MAKASFQLDPNAQSYTDDEIVGKINAAVATINRENAVASPAVDLSGKDLDDIGEGIVNKHLTETKDTKLSGIEDNAKGDQTGAEIRDLVVALADSDRKIVITDPQSGEFKVLAIHRDAAGKLDIDYDDVAV